MANRKLMVEVCNAHNLMPKDGQGSASAYVQVDYDGQRKRTRTKVKDLNPVWDEKFEFWVNNDMAEECVDATIYNEKKNGRRSNFLGRVCIFGCSVVKQGEEALIYYPLEKRGLFSHIKGELGLKVYYVDEEPPAPPPESAPEPPPPEAPAPPPPEPAPPAEVPPPTEEAPPPPPPEGEAAPPPSTEEQPKPPEEDTRLPPMSPRHANSMDYPTRETYPPLGATYGDKVSTYDLVEKMKYLFVRVVKARNLAVKDLTGSSDPYVRVSVGSHSARTRTIPRELNPEWHEVFAFGKESLLSPIVDVTVWDEDVGKTDDFLGVVTMEVQEIPMRVPPDSPLAPQWYRLEEMRGEGRVRGDIMLAVWIGTQADEAFPEAWQSDTGGLAHTRSKVYLSPKLWYLRVNVIEAQDLQPSEKSRYPEVSVKMQLGFQYQRTRIARTRTTSPFWNEDVLFVAAEPFEEHLLLQVLDHHGPNKDEILGHSRISLHSVERRVDHRLVASRWFNLEKSNGDSSVHFRGRIHLRVCFDGGYHVMDETAHLSSDFRPTAKQLWTPALGMLEVGVLGAQGLLPMKTKDGRGGTDAYCVAKYGPKWVRTRTIIDSFNPRWNEQYTWEVYDPCTVLTVGVFDNCHLQNTVAEKTNGSKDVRIGKVRIRLSTLETERVYTNLYPLLLLHPSGAKKMGEIELAVRFSSYSLLNLMHIYSQPPLPRMHYLHPLGIMQQDFLRHTAMKMVAQRMSRSEPALRPEVVQYMLDTDSNRWSMRRSKANWFRIMSVLAGVVAVIKWLDEICQWKNSVTTILVHVLFVILVLYPELILPTVFLYMFLIGAWHYRFRPRSPSYMDSRISHADAVDHDELDEEFDTIPTSRPPEVVRHRYDRLKSLAGRIQTVLGDVAAQGERIQALLSWRDPRATAIFITFCFLSAIVLYVAPIRLVLLFLGLYYLRHPRFRQRSPPVVLNFFRRLPALSDRIL